jgi:hypothetical protein
VAQVERIHEQDYESHDKEKRVPTTMPALGAGIDRGFAFFRRESFSEGQPVNDEENASRQ